MCLQVRQGTLYHCLLIPLLGSSIGTPPMVFRRWIELKFRLQATRLKCYKPLTWVQLNSWKSLVLRIWTASCLHLLWAHQYHNNLQPQNVNLIDNFSIIINRFSIILNGVDSRLSHRFSSHPISLFFLPVAILDLWFQHLPFTAHPSLFSLVIFFLPGLKPCLASWINILELWTEYNARAKYVP